MRYQIIIAGVGGQGTLFATKILTELARLQDVPIIGSENHGMSQRGGSVVSHLKLGEFRSPMVRAGDADLLIGIDALETRRNLSFLRAANGGPGALCVASTPGVDPFVPAAVLEILRGMGVKLLVCPADAVAIELGNPLTANLVLLGLAATEERFPFHFDWVCDAVASVSAPAFCKVNVAALERGRALAG